MKIFFMLMLLIYEISFCIIKWKFNDSMDDFEGLAVSLIIKFTPLAICMIGALG